MWVLRIASPDETSTTDSDLLIGWDILSWFLEVSDVCDSDHPFEGGRPEENYSGALIKERRSLLVKGPAGWRSKDLMLAGQGMLITAF